LCPLTKRKNLHIKKLFRKYICMYAKAIREGWRELNKMYRNKLAGHAK
jgi:hypothetical protein